MKAILTIILFSMFRIANAQSQKVVYQEIEAIDFRLMKELSNIRVYTEINEKRITFTDINTGRIFLIIDKRKAKKNYRIYGVEAEIVDNVLKIKEGPSNRTLLPYRIKY